MAALAVVVFVGAYILIITERIHRVAAALGGAGIMLAAGVVGAEDAFFSEETGVDWNVIFLLLGMMIIVGVLRETGVFEYMAIWAAKKAKGEPFRVMVTFVLLTAFASALLDNVTTVLLVAPVTLLVCLRLGVPPVPFLIAEVLASNIGGAATLIGDPPNIIIASRADLSFNDFLFNMGPIVVLLLIVYLGLCRFLFRKAFSYDRTRVEQVMSLNEKDAIEDRVLLIKAGAVLALVTVGFVLHSALDTEVSVVALLGAGLLVSIAGLSPKEYLGEVELPTLAFFAGLFIMVGALIKVGVIGSLSELVTEVTGGDLLLATMLLLVVSGVMSGIVDNIPYVATMAPLVASLAEDTGNPGNVLWWALALGADLGGNTTIVGASANVVVIGIAERNGYHISFLEFFKYGGIVALITIVLCVPYLWLRYFVFA
ncbi:MAG: ArsB/NhaD family transporter [Geodermatophilaceae bacterium]|nr:ArsB/NhaD family transporter [Geodermatophilaceae bacterium]MDQ3465622.1 ArsB/NhaD family transporter [Actinomycetota bacterium]